MFHKNIISHNFWYIFVFVFIAVAKSVKNAANDITGKTQEFVEGAANRTKDAGGKAKNEATSAVTRLRQPLGNLLN